MSLFVDVGFELFNSGGYGSVTALLFKTLEAGKDTLGKEELLLLDSLDVRILLFLFQVPLVNSEDETEDNAQSGDYPGNG